MDGEREGIERERKEGRQMEGERGGNTGGF